MKTFLGEPIYDDTLGIFYLCKYEYNPPRITVLREIQHDNPYDTLEMYSNIPNPESQMASGNTQEEFFKELQELHDKLNDANWVKQLGDYL